MFGVSLKINVDLSCHIEIAKRVILDYMSTLRTDQLASLMFVKRCHTKTTRNVFIQIKWLSWNITRNVQLSQGKSILNKSVCEGDKFENNIFVIV